MGRGRRRVPYRKGDRLEVSAKDRLLLRSERPLMGSWTLRKMVRIDEVSFEKSTS
jgi:hypothetical protein